MSWEGIKRESLFRHQSERLLDRNLLRYEINERKQNLKDYEKPIEKKIKTEENNQTDKNKVVKTDLKPEDVVLKLLKPLSSQNKAQKALDMLKSYLLANINLLKQKQIFHCIYELIINEKYFMKNDDKKNVLEIFELIEKSNLELLKDMKYKKVYDILMISGFHLKKMILTDDSYMFNNQLKIFKNLVEELDQSSSSEIDTTEKLPPQNFEEKQTKKKLISDKIEVNTENSFEDSKLNSSIEQKDQLQSIRSKLTKKKPELNRPKESQENINSSKENITKSMREDEKSSSTIMIIKKKLMGVKSESDKTKSSQSGTEIDTILNENYEFPPELQKLLDDHESQKDLKTEILFSASKSLLQFYKVPWAKSAVVIFFNDLLFKKYIFTNAQQKELEDLMDNLNSLKALDKTSSFKREYLDSKILPTPLQSINPVKDGRTITMSSDALDKWSSKQCGL